MIAPSTDERVQDKAQSKFAEGEKDKMGKPMIYVIALIVMAIVLTVTLALKVTWAVIKIEHSALLLAAPLVIFPLIFMLMDLILYNERRDRLQRRTARVSDEMASYQPNLQIWAMGGVIGIGVSVVYLLGKSIFSLLEFSSGSAARIDELIKQSGGSNPASDAAKLASDINTSMLWESLALLSALSVILSFVIWGFVRISKTE
jgi:hypothetical protein